MTPKRKNELTAILFSVTQWSDHSYLIRAGRYRLRVKLWRAREGTRRPFTMHYGGS